MRRTWTVTMRQTLIDLHGQGCSDKQIAEQIGMSRNAVATYRNNILHLQAHHDIPRPIPCVGCNKSFSSVRNMRRHARREHDAVMLSTYRPKEVRIGEPRRLKNTPKISMLTPRGGNFDSSRALDFLIDHWRKAA